MEFAAAGLGTEELWKALQKPLKHVAMQPITTARHIGDIQRFEIERLTRSMGQFRTLICVLSDRERVELGHVAQDRALFAEGALRAARWIAGREPGVYTMRDVLGL